jgi:phage terminase small subunit
MTPTEENLCDSYAKRLRLQKYRHAPGRSLVRKSRAALRRALFVEEFIAGGCASACAAARRAGFSEVSAGPRAWSLMRDPEIAAEIARRVDDRLARVCVTGDRLVRETAQIALVDPTSVIGADGRYKPVSEWPEDVRRAVSALEIGHEKALTADSGEEVTLGRVTSAKFHNKIEAINLLAKLLSMVVERSEVKTELSGPGGGPIQVQVAEARKSLMDKLATLRPVEVVDGEVIP